MAYIGMRHVIAAPITAETPGQGPTYGTGVILGRAISANITFNRSDNPLYADDVQIDIDNSVMAYQGTLNVDDVEDAVASAILGNTLSEGVLTMTDQASPDVGWGYIRVRRKNGTLTYQAYLYYKAKMGMDSEEAQTKQQQINWQTPQLAVRGTGVDLDGSGAYAYRTIKSFTTYAAAETWLDGQLNYTAPTTTTTTDTTNTTGTGT